MKKRKAYLVWIFFLCGTVRFFAQFPELDSLKLALKNAKHDSERVSLNIQISEMCEEADIYTYANEALLLSEKLLAKNFPGYKNRLLKFKADALNNIGYVLQHNGDNVGALEYYAKSQKARETVKDEKGVAATLNNIAFIYNVQGKIKEALDYYGESLSILEKLNDKKGVSICLNSLGSIYEYQDDLKKAREYYIKSFDVAKSIGDSTEMSVALINLAVFYDRDGDYDKAIETYLFCVRVFEKMQNPYGLATCYNNLGEIYGNKNDLQRSFAYYFKAIALTQVSGDKFCRANALNNLAVQYFSLGKSDSALVLSHQALQLGREQGSLIVIRRAAESLYTLYQSKKQFKETLEMYELYVNTGDSINNEKNRKASIRTQLRYEYDKRAAADSVAHATDFELKNAEIARQKAEIRTKKNVQYALFGGLGLVLVFSGFMYNRFKITQKQKQIIEAQKYEVEQQKHLVEEKQKEIVDSIQYAKRIQNALITNEKYLERTLDRLKIKT